MTTGEKISGFSDVEMGPLISGKATHERKKKTVSSDGHDGIGNVSASPGRPGDLKTIDLTADSNAHHHRGSAGISSAPSSSASTDKYARSKSSVVAGKVAFACVLYCFCSVSMVLVNKSLASR